LKSRDIIISLATQLLRMCQGTASKDEINNKICELGEKLQETEYEMHPDGVKEME